MKDVCKSLIFLANFDLLGFHRLKFQIPTAWVFKIACKRNKKNYLFGHENGVWAPSNVRFGALLLLNFNFVVI